MQNRWILSPTRAESKMVLDEGEISQNFGLVRLVGGESLVSQRTLFSSDSK